MFFDGKHRTNDLQRQPNGALKYGFPEQGIVLHRNTFPLSALSHQVLALLPFLRALFPDFEYGVRHLRYTPYQNSYPQTVNLPNSSGKSLYCFPEKSSGHNPHSVARHQLQ